jgi:hypothetical protein
MLMSISVDYNLGTAEFFVNIEAAADKSTYKGRFVVKCVLSPLDYIQSDATYRELLGKTNPQYANEYVSQLSYALSQLKYRIKLCPSWFENSSNGIKGSHVDDNILLHILDKAIEAEELYRNGIEEKYKKAREEVKKAVDDGTLNDGRKVEQENND